MDPSCSLHQRHDKMTKRVVATKDSRHHQSLHRAINEEFLRARNQWHGPHQRHQPGTIKKVCVWVVVAIWSIAILLFLLSLR